MSHLRAFLALDGADKLATLEAIVELAHTNWLVGSVPPRRWRSLFRSMERNDPPQSIDLADVEAIRRVRLAISRAMIHVPSPANCLPQALAARNMLKRRGIASSLYIGTERDSKGIARLRAWLKVGEEWVTGLCDESRYALHLPGDAEAA